MTLIIIILTSITSVMAFSDSRLFSKFQFNAYRIYHKKEWYRLVTHGLLHADWLHLIVNMLVLYSFGTGIEHVFRELQFQGIIRYPLLLYGILYFSAIVIASLLSLKKYKHFEWYNSVGASGAVSAVVFFHLFFAPWQRIYFYMVLPIPGIIFGVLYLAYSQYMSRRGGDNINHDAHFVGAVYGFLFPLVLEPRLIHYFINQLINFSW